MPAKTYKQMLEEAPCECIGGLIEVQYGKWYETYLTYCQKCNGGEDSVKDFSEIRNLVE